MKKKKSKIWGISQIRATVYVLCNALILFTGIILMMIGGDNPNGFIHAALIAVGTSMIATAICGYVTFSWVIYSDNEEEKRKQINNAAERIGLVDAFEKRSVGISSEYQTRLKHAKYRIDIIGFGLSALLNDFGEQFETWATKCNVRILLIDPDFPYEGNSYAQMRDLEERSAEGSIKAEVCTFLKKTETLWRDENISFNVRLATVLPSINLFRIDNEMFWGPYLVNSGKSIQKLESRSLPTFIIDDTGFLFSKFESHFNAIWEDPDKSCLPRNDLLS